MLKKKVSGLTIEKEGDCITISGYDLNATQFMCSVSLNALKEVIKEMENEEGGDSK